MFNDQVASDMLQQQGGVNLSAMGTDQRTARIQAFQTEAMRSRLSRVADVLGTVDQMLGGGQPIARILDIVESISGKNIAAAGVDAGQVRRQFEQLGGLADVL